MIVCTICARGGSKGVKNKNLRLINGKPLIHYSVKQALDSKLFDCVAVSSDSEEILSAAKTAGAHFTIKRPDELATDTSAKLPVIQHAMKTIEEKYGKPVEYLMDLDCTSPLRNISDIKDSFKSYKSNSEASNLITGAPARRSPYFNLVEENSAGFVTLAKKSTTPIVRRQDAPKCFDMNASIYIWRRQDLLEGKSVLGERTIIFEMPEERSLDIDSEFDFKIVELLMGERGDL
ncbi:MAG: acylneuraminate cytidylyltransferase family protein [Bdellovibrionota bacterium]